MDNSQHPRETTEQLDVDALQIRDRHLLLQDHLVEADDEVRVQEPAVEDRQAQAAADELEVVQVFRVDARRGVDLERVVVVRGVLEQAVERLATTSTSISIHAFTTGATGTHVEHLMRKQEEKLPRHAPIVQPVLPVELDHQPLLQVRGRLPHDLRVRVLEDVVPPDLDLAVARLRAHGGLAPEVDELPAEVALVLRDVLV